MTVPRDDEGRPGRTPTANANALGQESEDSITGGGLKVLERRRLEMAWRRFYGRMTTTEMRRIWIEGELLRYHCSCEPCQRRQAAWEARAS